MSLYGAELSTPTTPTADEPKVRVVCGQRGATGVDRGIWAVAAEAADVTVDASATMSRRTAGTTQM